MKIKTSGEIFQSPLVPAAAVFYTLAALLGISGVVLLFDSSYAQLLRRDLILSGFTDPSSVQTWTLINSGISIVCFICPCVSAVCLWIALAGRRLKGLFALSNAAAALLFCVNAGGVISVIVFAIRFVWYIIANLNSQQVVYAISAMLLFETVMVVQAVFLFRLLRKFLDSIMDTTAGIACALASEKPERCCISGFTGTGLFLLGILTLVLSLDRMFTLTIVPHSIQDYLAILTAEHPGMWLSGCNLLALSAGNFLMSLYLRRCKRDTERCAFYISRQNQ